METPEAHDNRSESNRSFHNHTSSYNQIDHENGDEVDLLRMKYKQSDNRVYHDFFKTKMCSLFFPEYLQKGKELSLCSL
jgi:hypothetical protein